MKNKCVLIVVLTMFAAFSAGALEGRVVVVVVGDDAAAFAPVSLASDATADAPLEAVNVDTGEVAPVTVHGERLIFVPPTLTSGQEQRFEIKAAAGGQAPRVRLEHDEAEGTVKVYIRDEHFTTYNFGEDVRIPFLWPVYAEGGVTITRNYPMGEDAPVESSDHRHHISLWTAFGDVNRADTWHRAPINTESIEAVSGDAFGAISAHHVWCDHRGTPLVDEMREYRFYDGPAGIRLIDQTITFNAVHGDVRFGDNKEGIVAFRIRPEIQGNQAGRLTDSAGNQGERNVYGTPGPWMDFSGAIAGIGNRGIALFSHPDNFRDPCWHVRDYGLFAANPFALSEVAKLDEDGAHELKSGESLTLAYRFYIHSGDVEEAGVAKHYATYANAPTATWAE